MVEPFNEAELRATAIAHAIRLGKCPPPGLVMGFNIQVRQIEETDLAAGELEKAVDLSEKVPFEFVVTEEDIEAGKRLINEQRATYREPKLTTVAPSTTHRP